MKTIFFVVVISCASFYGCSESLPFVSDPNNIFSGNTIPKHFVDNNYVSFYTFDIVLKNTYDETLEGNSKIFGTLEVDWKDAPITVNPKKTITFTEKELIFAKGYNVQEGKLTMNPGDSLIFRVTWDLTTNDGSELLKNLPYNVFNEISCLIRVEPYDSYRGALVSKALSIGTKAVIQLFNNKATIQVSQNFKLCFIQKYYSGGQCVRGYIQNPCDLK